MRRVLLVPLLLLSGGALAAPQFTREEVPEHMYGGGWEHFVGGGVAVFDCNGDHMPELFVAGGANPTQLLINTSERKGALQFEPDDSAEVSLTGATGAYPLDMDNDGFLDLVVLRVGENIFLKGGPECSFSPFDPNGLHGGDDWTTAFTATWEQSEDLPTLAFGNYVDRTDPDGPFEACDTNRLFRPQGLAYSETPLRPGFCPLSALFSDWNRDGQADLRLSNDRHYYVRGGSEQMWELAPEPRLLSEEDGWLAHELWGMGIASRDLDFDGRPEVFLTSMGDQRLQRLADGDDPTWVDVAYDMGTTAHRPYTGGDGRPSTGWHVAFGDIQNDGLDDAFIAKGNVDQMPGSAFDDPNNLLLQKPDGSFMEIGDAVGVATMDRSRGAALADLNSDGLLDLVVVNRRAPMEVYRNTSAATGNWLTVMPRQAGINTHAIGAFIELDLGGRSVVREVVSGGGHAGGSAVPEHFGLGDLEEARMRLVWPDGAASDWKTLRANKAYEMLRSGPETSLRAY